jgi:hypothetical protein
MYGRENILSEIDENVVDSVRKQKQFTHFLNRKEGARQMIKFQMWNTVLYGVFSVSLWCLVTLEPSPAAAQQCRKDKNRIEMEMARPRLYCNVSSSTTWVGLE